MSLERAPAWASKVFVKFNAFFGGKFNTYWKTTKNYVIEKISAFWTGLAFRVGVRAQVAELHFSLFFPLIFIDWINACWHLDYIKVNHNFNTFYKLKSIYFQLKSFKRYLNLFLPVFKENVFFNLNHIYLYLPAWIQFTNNIRGYRIIL